MKAIFVTDAGDGHMIVVTRPFTTHVGRHVDGTRLLFSANSGDFLDVKETPQEIAFAIGAVPVAVAVKQRWADNAFRESYGLPPLPSNDG